MTAMRAGLHYFAAVFAVGIVLGAFRVLIAAPRTGETLAVLIETPVILAASWWICGVVVRRLAVDRSAAARLTMGLTAFGALIVAEIILSIVGFGRSWTQIASHYAQAPGLIGLAGQAAFGLFPLIRLRLER